MVVALKRALLGAIVLTTLPASSATTFSVAGANTDGGWCCDSPNTMVNSVCSGTPNAIPDDNTAASVYECCVTAAAALSATPATGECPTDGVSVSTYNSPTYPGGCYFNGGYISYSRDDWNTRYHSSAQGVCGRAPSPSASPSPPPSDSPSPPPSDSPSPPPVDEDPCLPTNSTFFKADGSTCYADGLRDGDEILAVKADGTLTYDQVALPLSIAKPGVEAKFITITTKAGSALNLTANHHIPVGSTCCSTLKKAEHVEIGDTVWVVRGESIVAEEVARLTEVIARGLHSPVLAHGSFPVVNKVVTSFDAIGKVTLASYGLAPLLKACAATGTCGMLRYVLLGN